jgi:hypothetical protein
MTRVGPQVGGLVPSCMLLVCVGCPDERDFAERFSGEVPVCC